MFLSKFITREIYIRSATIIYSISLNIILFLLLYHNTSLNTILLSHEQFVLINSIYSTKFSPNLIFYIEIFHLTYWIIENNHPRKKAVHSDCRSCSALYSYFRTIYKRHSYIIFCINHNFINQCNNQLFIKFCHFTL